MKYWEDITEFPGHLQTDPATGLSQDEAENRLKKFGSNALTEEKKINPLIVLLHQFNNLMTYLLLAAASISFIYKDWPDGIAIIAVILINSFIGFRMEMRADFSMRALKQMISLPVKVVREGKVKEIESEFLVPGDIIVPEAGDIIAADARILSSNQLITNEASLTGESLPVEKKTGVAREGTVLAERFNTLYKGTFLMNGSVKALVTATGMKTEIGKIAKMVQQAEDSVTPLEEKLNALSKKLIFLTIILVTIIFVIGLISNEEIHLQLKTAIALAVAAIPEGLPIVATLALAQGMLKLARKNVVIKKLSAVETLGGTDVICTDKTGTLTRNKIDVAILHLSNDKIIGSSSQPLKFNEEDKNDPVLSHLVRTSILCNTSFLQGENKKEIGDPLETSLLRFASDLGNDIPEVRNNYKKVNEIPFNSERKMMFTSHQINNEYFIDAKGAIEEILGISDRLLTNGKNSHFTETDKKKWLDLADKYAADGFRILGFAWRKNTDDSIPMNKYIFNGLICFIDPPADGVKEAVKECRDAGIKIVMITGDHPLTALNIARQTGIADETEEKYIKGSEMFPLKTLTGEDKQRWSETSVFARVNPSQKLDLISVLQEKKHIVAMTGDGVNDAPALKKADIGIAMGIRGTQVAREAADMILKDDSFTSIVYSVKRGRVIFRNIRMFVIYLLSCNLSEILIVSAISFLTLPFQLLPIQILFLNLVTDVFPALALGFGEGNKKIMSDPPRNPREAVITKRNWLSICLYASVMAACCIAAPLFSEMITGISLTPQEGNNLLFYTLIITQLLHVFNLSDVKSSFFINDVTKNKFVWAAIILSLLIPASVYFIPVAKDILQLQLLPEIQWVIIISLSLINILIIQLFKRINIFHING